MINIWSIDTY